MNISSSAKEMLKQDAELSTKLRELAEDLQKEEK
jgi:hypothetical protein